MAKLLAAAVSLLFLLSSVSAYILNWTRDEMLDEYHTVVEPKLPRSAKMLLGDERINVYVGGKVIGIMTLHGELSYFELSPVDNPTIVATVSDSAAEAIEAKTMGLMAALESGGIRIEGKNLFSILKVEAIKRIYALSGADAKILGRKQTATAAGIYNSLFVQKARITN